MPEDKQKKREHDRRYREKQKLINPQYMDKRRDVCRKSYKKLISEMSSSDIG